MAKFKEGQYIAAVRQKKFMEDLQDGKYVIAKIIRIAPSSVGGEGNFYYQAQSEDGNVYMAFERNINQGLYEFIEISELVRYLERFGNEKLSDGYYLIDKANKVRQEYL